MHTLVQKYSSLFYPDCVAALVDAELELLDHKPLNTEHLKVTKRVTAATWAGEDEEMITIVTTTLDAEKAVRDSEVAAEPTPQDYQQYILFC